MIRGIQGKIAPQMRCFFILPAPVRSAVQRLVCQANSKVLLFYQYFFVTDNQTDLTPSCLWHFVSPLNNSEALDKIHNRVIHLEGGAYMKNTTDAGLVADTNGGWLSLKETNGETLENLLSF